MRKIEITLADRDVGTTAVMTERKWFRTSAQEFLCVKADRLFGADWINTKTGESPSFDIQHALNNAAQAAAGVLLAKKIAAARAAV